MILSLVSIRHLTRLLTMLQLNTPVLIRELETTVMGVFRTHINEGRFKL